MCLQDFYNNHWWLGAVVCPALLTVIIGFPISYWASIVSSSKIIFAQNKVVAFSALAGIPVKFLNGHSKFHQFETMVFSLLHPAMQGFLSIYQVQAAHKLDKISDEFKKEFLAEVRRNMERRLKVSEGTSFYDVEIEFTDAFSPEAKVILSKTIDKIEKIRMNKLVLFFGIWPFDQIEKFKKKKKDKSQ